jgi:hypothetical protein
MKALTALFLVGGLLVAGTSSYVFAQTYGYVDQSGDLRVTTANTPEEAIAATVSTRAANSGVMEMNQSATQSSASTNPNIHTYGYITNSGTLGLYAAGSAEAAIAGAPNRAPNSGVMLLAQ